MYWRMRVHDKYLHNDRCLIHAEYACSAGPCQTSCRDECCSMPEVTLDIILEAVLKQQILVAATAGIFSSKLMFYSKEA